MFCDALEMDTNPDMYVVARVRRKRIVREFFGMNSLIALACYVYAIFMPGEKKFLFDSALVGVVS